LEEDKEPDESEGKSSSEYAEVRGSGVGVGVSEWGMNEWQW